MSLVTPRKGYKLVKWWFGKTVEIPEKWKIEKLKELCTVRQGLQIPISDRLSQKGKNRFQYITIKAIHSNEFNEYIENPSERVICTENNILFTRTGNTGEIITNVNGVFHNNFFLIDFDKQQLLKEFLIVSLKQHKIQGMIKSLAGTTTIPDLNHGDFFKLQILIPSLPEQQKITTILSNVDSLIESTSKVIENSKKIKKGLMQELLTRGIGHTKFKKVLWLFGKKIEIPQEWEVLPLFKICDIRELNSVNSDMYIGLEHISQNDNKLVGQATTEEYASNSNSFHIDDVLYGKLRPLLNKVWLATEEGHCSTDILPLQIKDNIIAKILLLILTDYRFFWYAVSTSSGTKMPRTNWSDMKNFLVFLPSISEQQKIAAILSNIYSKITSQEQYKEKLQKLKKSLMQKLLTGEVRV